MRKNPSICKDCGDCPVENVSWNDVRKFINKLNEKTGKTYRLPTEAEWEYVAEGAFKYSGSRSLGEVAWYSINSDSKTHPVGQKQSNSTGLYDILGNVSEWCSDWYGSDYYKVSPGSNPNGPLLGSDRVCRGGGWIDNAMGCRNSFRNHNSPDYRFSFLGFRLVLVP